MVATRSRSSAYAQAASVAETPSQARASKIKAFPSINAPVISAEHTISHPGGFKEGKERPGGEEHVKREAPFAMVAAAPSPYESLKLQRVAENQARMAALGMQKHATSLTSFLRASKQEMRRKKQAALFSAQHLPRYGGTEHVVRRSERLKCSRSPDLYNPLHVKVEDDRSCSNPKSSSLIPRSSCRNYSSTESAQAKRRPGNAPLPKNCPAHLSVSSLLSTLRCRSKDRGSLYDSIVGICCHFCRQKKLCGEENCERCAHRDVTKPCLGKSDCSKCHSSTGVFCRACLKIRYGEDMDEVRQNPEWLCAHCSEEQGLDPHWICNSSICLSRRKIAPTGIAIYKAREMGFKSVAHYLADVLQKQAHGRGG